MNKTKKILGKNVTFTAYKITSGNIYDETLCPADRFQGVTNIFSTKSEAIALINDRVEIDEKEGDTIDLIEYDPKTEEFGDCIPLVCNLDGYWELFNSYLM